jgi:diguanylate cyclase (GGDEF)-like protein
VRFSAIHDEDGTIVGAVEVFTDNTPKFSALQRVEELEKVAYVDPLTGLPNRRYVETRMRARLDEMERYSWPFGLLYIDIDHFKRVNDEYGHDIGDVVLKMVARTLQHATRSFDVVGRWGGEEFLAVLAAVDKEKLHTIGERFRSLVENSAVSVRENKIRATISLGGVICREGELLDSLVKRADGLLYRSKVDGRNRLTLDD